MSGSAHRAPAATSAGVFAAFAPRYRAAGWVNVLVLPRGRKSPPPGGYTGGSRIAPSGADLWEWATYQPHGNIALGMARDVAVGGVLWDTVALDVDHYDKGAVAKRGGDTVAQVEADAGARFPPTWKTTSRGPGVSGKYLYRVPAGTGLVSVLPGIELVQHWHRYAVVPPSTNPHSSGSPFAWRTGARPAPGCDGRPTGAIPGPADLTVLPPALVTALHRDWAALTPVTLTRAEWQRWIAEAPDGLPCSAVRRRLVAAVAGVQGRAGVSRHEECLQHTFALLRLAEQGHTGTRHAVQVLRERFVESVADRAREAAARREFDRMVDFRAVGKILATPTDPDERGCGCPEGLAAMLAATGAPEEAAATYGIPIAGLLARIDDPGVRAHVARLLGRGGAR